MLRLIRFDGLLKCSYCSFGYAILAQSNDVESCRTQVFHMTARARTKLLLLRLACAHSIPFDRPTRRGSNRAHRSAGRVDVDVDVQAVYPSPAPRGANMSAPFRLAHVEAYSVVVVLAAFMISFLIDGTQYGYGIMASYWMQDLNSPRFQLDWIGSLQVGIGYCLGPVTSILARRFGFKAVTMAGGLISSAALFVCFVKANIPILFVFYGALTG
ncbi:unnamed protein product [Protopolystoma xenopodis]|uniref:Major facilitator superfamily (MFS) profile domain-containing protein n=1 Tax=Protopolystoma xenopodis TaxID=117903 RepID=A0A3S4ZR60_9PLAT|nr:unnamed protein product [Protopolystoma xenopodis]